MLRSPRLRSALAGVSLIALAAAPLMLPVSAGAATAGSVVKITDPAADTMKGDDPTPATSVDEPKADIIAASARYQNDHITFTMELTEGDDLSIPESRLWWSLGNDNGCCAFVSIMKAPDSAVRVVMGDPGTTPSADDTSRECAGSSATADVPAGTYTASLPTSCISAEPLASFQWSAGRRVPTGTGADVAWDMAPDADMADTVTNMEVFGYWAIGSDGKVYPFGDAIETGELATPALSTIDIEAAPHGNGYWSMDSQGVVTPFGTVHYGNVTDLKANEKATSMSSTPTGAGYWVFTNLGRAVAFGDATKDLGDVSDLTLNGEVLDSSPTPTGQGYYLVAADGGVFALGDAEYEGSMGETKLNKPVQSIVPDPDGAGYWLVASDGGVFAFVAPFKGSMGGTTLNKPMTGMVPYGDAYLMVAEDGGVFNFSDQPFSGSLGDNPPANAIVSITPLT